MSERTLDYVHDISADLVRSNNPMRNQKFFIHMPNAPREVANMFGTLPGYTRTHATLEEFCRQVDAKREGMYYTVPRIWNVPMSGTVKIPIKDVHDLIDIFQHREHRVIHIWWLELPRGQYEMEQAAFRPPRMYPDTSHVLRDLLVWCADTHPDWLAHEVEIRVLNSPPEIYAYKGAIKHLFYWLGDAIIGAELVIYTAQFARRVIDTRRALGEILALEVSNMWLEWPSHEQERERER